MLPPTRGQEPLRRISSRPLVPYVQKNANVPLAMRALGKSRFQSEEEHRFFQLYITKTATHLSGFYGPSLWNQIVLQASEAEESIRHAVISIGALDMNTVAGHAGRKAKEMEDHHVFALKQYSKALNALRQKAEVLGTKYDLRTALIASLLIICFETYHGNYESANRQTKAAMRLLESRSKGRSASTSECEVEGELARAFDRLDTQSMCQRDIYTLSEHLTFLDCHADMLATMPEVFDDVATARSFFGPLIRQTIHFACAFWAVYAPCPSFLTISSITKPKPNMRILDVAVPCISADFRAMKDHKLAQFGQWMKACEPLFEIKKKNKGSKECLAVAALRAQYLTGYIGLRTLGTMKETAYDEYIEGFREIVDSCEELEYHSGLAEVKKDGKGDGGCEMYVFDMQSVMPLDFIARKCRDPALRRRAIELLKARPRRELFWDSIIAAQVCEWVVKIEEEGLVDGVVKEENRARGVSIGPELGSGEEVKCAKVWCSLGTGERRVGIVEW